MEFVVPRTTHQSPADQFATKSPQQQKMTIRTEDNVFNFTVPYAPVKVTHTNLARGTAEVPRPGRAPLLLSMAPQLRKMSFSLMIGNKDPNWSAENALWMLRAMANNGVRVIVTLNHSETGIWRITSLSETSTRRRPITNEITRADVDVELTQASELVTHVGPLSGGVKPAPTIPTSRPVPRPPVSKPSPAPSVRYHVVRRGDTLWDLAVRYYRNGTLWRRIADANRLRNPNLIYPGQRLRIP
jgi:LysM repeat protein